MIHWRIEKRLTIRCSAQSIPFQSKSPHTALTCAFEWREVRRTKTNSSFHQVHINNMKFAARRLLILGISNDSAAMEHHIGI